MMALPPAANANTQNGCNTLAGTNGNVMSQTPRPTQSPRTIDPDTPIRSAVLDMVRSGVGALAVVDGSNRVVGLLSERELLRHLLSHYLPRAGGNTPSPPPATAKRTVRDVMTRQVLCVAPEQPLAEVASLMLNKDVDRVPVVKNGTLVGFLTRGDIVRKLIGT